ncbi:hypothetical protein [Methylosinus sp. Ce-a6]|uniref:hypothetical protein n=1 Tax=Methylosinus sp. Ce-a6 TaxID=2172005 RepID=UPI00135AF942|nr:hypothetical protein [Methylosinus sp. Ce-a6]
MRDTLHHFGRVMRQPVDDSALGNVEEREQLLFKRRRAGLLEHHAERLLPRQLLEDELRARHCRSAQAGAKRFGDGGLEAGHNRDGEMILSGRDMRRCGATRSSENLAKIMRKSAFMGCCKAHMAGNAACAAGAIHGSRSRSAQAAMGAQTMLGRGGRRPPIGGLFLNHRRADVLHHIGGHRDARRDDLRAGPVRFLVRHDPFAVHALARDIPGLGPAARVGLAVWRLADDGATRVDRVAAARNSSRARASIASTAACASACVA